MQGSFKALPLTLTSAAKLGDPVFTVGYPNVQIQGLSAKLTKGEINSLSGMQDDPRHFQMSVQVQPGNSGGPLVDMDGNVAGVIVMRLGDVATLQDTGSLPQNVNYAVKTAYVRPLLDLVPDCAERLPKPHSKSGRSFDDVAKEAEAATALVLVY